MDGVVEPLPPDIGDAPGTVPVSRPVILGISGGASGGGRLSGCPGIGSSNPSSSPEPGIPVPMSKSGQFCSPGSQHPQHSVQEFPQCVPQLFMPPFEHCSAHFPAPLFGNGPCPPGQSLGQFPLTTSSSSASAPRVNLNLASQGIASI